MEGAEEAEGSIEAAGLYGSAGLASACASVNSAPGSAAAQMVEAIAKDQRRVLPVCIGLDGEYGIKDCYLGVPVILGKNGVEKVIELQLNDEEKALLEISRGKVKEVMDVFDNMPK